MLLVFFIDKEKRKELFESVKLRLDFCGLCGIGSKPDVDMEQSVKQFKLQVRKSALQVAVREAKSALEEQAIGAQELLEQASEARKTLGAQVIECFCQQGLFNAYDMQDLVHVEEQRR